MILSVTASGMRMETIGYMVQIGMSGCYRLELVVVRSTDSVSMLIRKNISTQGHRHK